MIACAGYVMKSSGAKKQAATISVLLNGYILTQFYQTVKTKPDGGERRKKAGGCSLPFLGVR
jgi:hypothetical protein